MNQFDAFVQPHKEFRVRTAVGGYLTVCAVLISVFLFATELQFFMEMESKDVMVIDKNQDRKNFTYELALTLPEIPCPAVAINVVDIKHMNVIATNHFIAKQRLSMIGNLVTKSDAIRASLRTVLQTSAEMRSVLAAESAAEQNQDFSTARGRCPSCFQAEEDLDQCCRTCADVEEAWAKKGWEKPKDYVFEQCQENQPHLVLPELGEGCYIEASFTMRKKPVKMVIGLPTQLWGDNILHQNFFRQVEEGRLNWTHVIHGTSFGPKFPGFVPVLDGQSRVASAVHPGQADNLDNGVDESLLRSQYFQYDIHIIPTEYVPGNGEAATDSHQYSVTDFMKRINLYEDLTSSTVAPFGGIRFDLSFTPFRVSWIKSRKQWTHFLTECCAIVGGIIAFSTLVDNLWHRFAAKRVGQGEKWASLLYPC
eukprot:GEMP01014950.1.p1 GENE.GEMP01014950.1~~GEMP01014950.1.p1  ORF type:complete len:423 (+),score=96.33 GEMP01014950.1:470-1738(+)